MPEHDCPFCTTNDDACFHFAPRVRALWDRYPVAAGHALIVPRRHVASWFEATPAERAAMLGAVDAVRAIIDEKHSPDGYNLGLNIGAAAGQTVDHLHLHVIPRYLGDVPDPRGGVRHVLAGHGNYLLTPTLEKGHRTTAPSSGAPTIRSSRTSSRTSITRIRLTSPSRSR
jgi:diadenosine tetraphosphate (Ap4A) HIT family hydrolase